VLTCRALNAGQPVSAPCAHPKGRMDPASDFLAACRPSPKGQDYATWVDSHLLPRVRLNLLLTLLQ